MVMTRVDSEMFDENILGTCLVYSRKTKPEVLILWQVLTTRTKDHTLHSPEAMKKYFNCMDKVLNKLVTSSISNFNEWGQIV